MVMVGTGWTFVTRSGKIKGTLNAANNGINNTSTEIPRRKVSLTPSGGNHRGHKFRNKIHNVRERSLRTSSYERIKSDLIKMWEKSRPVILSCCIVGFLAGFIQLFISAIGLSPCVNVSLKVIKASLEISSLFRQVLTDYFFLLQINLKVRCWLIFHFCLFFLLVLCVLTTFLTNMNQEKKETWNYKIKQLEKAISRRKGSVNDETDDAEELTNYLYMSTMVFYTVLSIDGGLILLMFFGVIWFMKVDDGRERDKYEPVVNKYG